MAEANGTIFANYAHELKTQSTTRVLIHIEGIVSGWIIAASKARVCMRMCMRGKIVHTAAHDSRLYHRLCVCSSRVRLLTMLLA